MYSAPGYGVLNRRDVTTDAGKMSFISHLLQSSQVRGEQRMGLFEVRVGGEGRCCYVLPSNSSAFIGQLLYSCSICAKSERVAKEQKKKRRGVCVCVCVCDDSSFQWYDNFIMTVFFGQKPRRTSWLVVNDWSPCNATSLWNHLDDLTYVLQWRILKIREPRYQCYD